MEFINPDTAERPVFVLSECYQALKGHLHAHRRAQFIYASEGVLTVKTRSSLWIVPPQRAVWILPGIMHQVLSNKQFWLRTLYAEPGMVSMPETCCVVSVGPLLRELLITASTFGTAYPVEGPEQRLIHVIIDQLVHTKTVSTYLPRPIDPRLLCLTDKLEQDPSNADTLEIWVAKIGLTTRTAARLFIKETGMTFGQWRQQLRMLSAIEHLSMGKSVTEVALEVGYSDVSAFISVFKKTFGETPARYFC